MLFRTSTSSSASSACRSTSSPHSPSRSSLTLGCTPAGLGLLPKRSFSRFRRPDPEGTTARLESLGYPRSIAQRAATTHDDPHRASLLALHLAHLAAGETARECRECRECAHESRARWAADDRDPLPEKLWEERERASLAWRDRTRRHMAIVDKQRRLMGLRGYYTDDDPVSHLAPAHPGPPITRAQIRAALGAVPGLAPGLGGV